MEVLIIGVLVGGLIVAVFGNLIYRIGRSIGVQDMEAKAVRAGYGYYKIINDYGQTVFEWNKKI